MKSLWIITSLSVLWVGAAVAMPDGTSAALDVVGGDGLPARVSSQNTDYHRPFPQPFSTTDDPGWDISKGGSQLSSPDISVIATDGTIRGLKISCEFHDHDPGNVTTNPPIPGKPDRILCRFVISKPNSGDDDREDCAFDFKDPNDGQWYKASFLPVTVFPGSPPFTIARTTAADHCPGLQ
jgi:hypothetical protein